MLPPLPTSPTHDVIRELARAVSTPSPTDPRAWLPAVARECSAAPPLAPMAAAFGAALAELTRPAAWLVALTAATRPALAATSGKRGR